VQNNSKTKGRKVKVSLYTTWRRMGEWTYSSTYLFRH